jgi:2-keto-3-deoxy-L-rhamnonate aldolase RhmA
MTTLKEKLVAGEVVFGGSVSEHLRPSVVKAYAHAGFDFIFLENEHASFGRAAMADFVLCARDNGLTVVSKLPHLERGQTAWLLEMGVMGVQLPRTESSQELETLYDYMKFPPVGSRASATGFGNTGYAKVPDKAAWYTQANAETFVVGHIETKKGVENAEDILTATGTDVCFVGASDLSVSYGMPGNYTDPQFQALVQRVFDCCQARGIVCGFPGFGYDSVRYWIDHGVQFFECANELDMIRSGAAKAVEQLHKARDR